MKIKELKKLIADMPDDAPVLLSVSDYKYKEAWHMDSIAVYHIEDRLYEEFVGDWQVLETGIEKRQALCLY